MESLPKEVIVQNIFVHFKDIELANLMPVCKLFQRLSSTRQLWTNFINKWPTCWNGWIGIPDGIVVYQYKKRYIIAKMRAIQYLWNYFIASDCKRHKWHPFSTRVLNLHLCGSDGTLKQMLPKDQYNLEMMEIVFEEMGKPKHVTIDDYMDHAKMSQLAGWFQKNWQRTFCDCK